MCLILFIFSIAAVSAADVNQAVDDELNVYLSEDNILGSADGGTFTELQDKINAAEEGSTINLENNYTHDENGSISINKSITINGNGYTLDARGAYSILHIESDNVVLKNITFINSDEWGTAVSVYGNNTIISDCNFENNRNYELGMGGALFIKGSNTIISNCCFENNCLSGLVDIFGGAIGICGNDTLISDCYFEDNYVSGEYSSGGGAIFCDGDLTVVNSTFISNTVSCYGSLGGAIYSKGNLSISDSFFTDNTLYGVNVYGGAIYAESVYVNNSAFESNNIHAFKSWETGSSARGGAISSQAAYISNSNFMNNSASSDDEYNPSSGGAVRSLGILNVEGSNFENNTADKGEALWAYLVYSNIDDCNFTNNDYVLVKAYIVAWDLNKLYGGSEQFRVYLTEDDKVLANARVTININGINYFRTTNEEGIALMDINLNPGEYNATVTYEDACAISKITIVSTVDGENLTKIFINATQYRATFWDSEGYRLNNTQVEFNINGILYKRFTDDEGVAKLNINLNPGEYIITAKNTNSGELYSNVITVLPNMDENHDLIKYYRNDSQYVVRLLDDEGNPVGAGVNVTFNINGVFYNRTTNATGYAKLNINLQPGTYIITAIYKDLAMANTITVLPVLEAENLEMKYHDGSQFNVTLLDGQGKPYAGQNVTFNVNGVFYVRNTDVNGVTHLNINLMAGEYIITSSYNNSNIANKITISS